MTPHSLIILCTLLLITISPCIHHISAVDYQINNEAPDTPGGKRFTEIIGIQGAKEMMGQVNEYICSTIFQQNSPETRKPIDTLLLSIVNNDTYEAWSDKHMINISANYIHRLKEDVKTDFTRTLYVHMTYVLQWIEEDKCPYQLLVGFGFFTIIKVKLIPEGFPEPGDGDTWDQEGYVIARFLEYCDEVTPGFVAKLNEKMKTTYDVSYFKEITRKSVDELWKDYKSKHDV